MSGKTEGFYEVLSPWAEADPVPQKGLAPRLTDLQGKRIGLLRNNKRAAEPMLKVAAQRLGERYPGLEFIWFYGNHFSVSELEKDRRQEFEDWINSVDAVVASAGD
ncbi:MAG: hypothetical protein JXA46_07715 [Dehalococcoidales bacterium]|nr:hypothetical protein [Dehalococcoidales bacterium]